MPGDVKGLPCLMRLTGGAPGVAGTRVRWGCMPLHAAAG